MTGQLPSLSWFGPLCDLDLELPRRREVGRSHAEPSRGHLFDGAVRPVAVLTSSIPRRIFATFPAVALAADPVHGDGQCLVCLLGQCPVRHRGGGKPPAYRFDGLHLVNQNGPAPSDGHQVPQCRGRPAFYKLRIGLEVGEGSALGHPVDGLEYRGIVCVVLPVPTVAVDALLGRRAVGAMLERLLMEADRRIDDLVDPDAADLRRGPCKATLDDLLVEPDGVEELCAMVAAQVRDPHLREDLEDAHLHGLSVVLESLVVPQAGLQASGFDQIRQGLICQIGIDGAGAVADEAREVVYLARLPGFDHQACQRSLPLSEQMVVNGTHREEHGKRGLRR